MDEMERKRKESLLILCAQVEVALSYTIMLLNKECGRIAVELKEVSRFKQKKDYSTLLKLLKDVDNHLDQTLWPFLLDLYKNEDGTYGAQGLDVKLFEGNELARLVMLYADKTAKSNDNYEKIFTAIGGLKGLDVLDQETYDRFYLKTLKTNEENG